MTWILAIVTGGAASVYGSIGSYDSPQECLAAAMVIAEVMLPREQKAAVISYSCTRQDNGDLK